MQNHAEVFAALRPRLLEGVVRSSSALHDTFNTLPQALMREHLDLALEQMSAYLADQNPKQLAEFVARWITVLRSAGLTNRSILRAVVTLGDLIVQGVKGELSDHPESERFVREVVRLNFLCARTVVSLFAEEVRQREAARTQHG